MSKTLKRFLCILSAIALVIGVATPFALNNKLQTDFYKIKSDKIHNDFRIALVTDFHSENYGENQKELTEKIDDIKPDIIALSGDIFDDEEPQKNSIVLLREITKKYSCFYVTGNHEAWTGRTDEIKKIAAEYGVTVLESNVVVKNICGESINICGVDDPDVTGDYDFSAQKIETPFEKKAIENLKKSDKRNFTLFLSHRPERQSIISKAKCVDLVLAGHAHGGLLRLPFTNISVFAPNQGLFPKYTQGVYNIDYGKMVVSRGLERRNYGVLRRTFNRPELAVIDVTAD